MRGVDSRGLETQSCPRTGLLMTSDVADGASVVSRLGGGASHREARRARRSGESVGVPSTRRAAGPVAPDRGRGARRRTRGRRSATNSVLTRLELDVWLTRSLPRYAARNFSIEKTVPRDSM